MLHADAQLFHRAVQVHLDAIAALQLLQGCADLPLVQQGQGAAGTDEAHILHGVEPADQHEVLMDHADAVGHGLFGRGDPCLLPLHQDLSGIGAVDAVNNVHQGALAGAVLAQQGQYLAPVQDQVDGVIGRRAAEELRDPPQFQQGRLVLPAHLQWTSHHSSWTGGICSRMPGARRLQMMPLLGRGNSWRVSMMRVGVTI